MAQDERSILDVANAEIERTLRDPEIGSKQPRFMSPMQFFNQTLGMVRRTHLEAPPYGVDSRMRDEWLTNFWRNDPFLSGVLYSVVAIDRNRGWTMIGGRNQVRRFTDVLYSADGGAGWREYIERQALSFYTTDMGAITEVARRTRSDDAPMGALYHLDSTRVKLTGKHDEPIEYRPTNGGTQIWRRSDFWRVASMVSNQEKANGLGYCAVSRLLDMAKLAIGLVVHDQEQLGLSMPPGFLMINNFNQDAWDRQMEKYQAERANSGAQYANNVMVLFGESGEIGMKFHGMSQVPQHMILDVFVNIMMQVYALCFGRDSSEFWTIKTGALGIGALSLVQSEKATAKGEMDFVQGWQTALEQELPDTVHFTFDERGDGGDQLHSEVMDRVTAAVQRLYTPAVPGEQPLLTRDEARTLLADRGIIRREWIADADEAESTDVMRAKYLARYSERVALAAERFPDEPIVAMRHNGRVDMLYRHGEDLIRRRTYPVKPKELIQEGGEMRQEE